MAQLFQNINNNVSNTPNREKDLSKNEVENIVKEQLSSYQKISLMTKTVSVAALAKIGQSETLQAKINRSTKLINTVDTVYWANNTAQNVPLTNIRLLTENPSVMPFRNMSNHEGKPLTETEQNAQ